MQLLLTTCVINVTLIANAGLSLGQQDDDSSLVVAVLDVQKILDSMPELQKEQKALEEFEAKTANATPVICRRGLSPRQIKARAFATTLGEEYSRIRKVTADIAESRNINLVIRVATTGLSNGDSLKLEQVDNSNGTKFVYRDNMNLTQAVIERLHQADRSPLPKEVEEDENAKPVIAIIDVERVVRMVYRSESAVFEKKVVSKQEELNATLAKIRIAVSDLSKIHGIKAVLTGDTDGIFYNGTLDNVNKAISNPLVYHRRLDLTYLVAQYLKNDAKKQVSR